MLAKRYLCHDVTILRIAYNDFVYLDSVARKLKVVNPQLPLFKHKRAIVLKRPFQHVAEGLYMRCAQLLPGTNVIYLVVLLLFF